MMHDAVWHTQTTDHGKIIQIFGKRQILQSVLAKLKREREREQEQNKKEEENWSAHKILTRERGRQTD